MKRVRTNRVDTSALAYHALDVQSSQRTPDDTFLYFRTVPQLLHLNREFRSCRWKSMIASCA
jgi:hypothetical protein